MPAAAKPEVVDDAAIAEAMPEVFKRLNLPEDLQADFLPSKPTAPGRQPAAGQPNGDSARAAGSTPAAKVPGEGEPEPTAEEQEAAEAEQTRLEQLATESGKTVEDIQAEEAETARLQTLADESGKSVEEIQAEEAAAAAQDSPEAKLTKATADLEAATARVQELENELKVRTARPLDIGPQPVHPILTAENEQDIARFDAQLAQFEKWAINNWEGTEAVEGKGDHPGTPAYTAAQIRERYSQIKEQRAKLVPLAKELLQDRRAMEAEAKAAYPDLFDTKKPDAQMAQQIIAQAPGLKAIFPNIMMVIGDAIRGERLRKADEAKKAAAAKNGGKTPPVRIAPKLPVRAAAGAAKPIAGAKAKATGTPVNIDKFHARGGDRDALVETIMESGLVGT